MNEVYRRKYGVQHQLLHAWKLEFSQMEGALEKLSGRDVTAPVPKLFQDVLKGIKIEEMKR